MTMCGSVPFQYGLTGVACSVKENLQSFHCGTAGDPRTRPPREAEADNRSTLSLPVAMSSSSLLITAILFGSSALEPLFKLWRCSVSHNHMR